MTTLRAFVWLRWRLVLNSLRGSRRRDTLEQLSRAFAMIVPIAIVTMAFGSVIATTILGFLGGRAVATGLIDAPVVLLILRGVLLALVVVLVIFAIVSPIQASLTRYNRLLLLPISHRLLHLVEVSASLADPWIAFLAPGLFTFAIGLSFGGQTGAGFIAAAAAVAMLAVLAAISALTGFLVAWLFRSRRRSEMFTVVFVIVLSVGGFVPMIIAERFDDDRDEARRQGRRGRNLTAEQFNASLPAWTIVLPPELYGRTVQAGLEGRPAAAGLALTGLAAEAAVLFVLSSMVHRRLIGSTGGESRRAKAEAVEVAVRRLPGLSPAASAAAMAQVRNAGRSVRGRLLMLLSGPMLAGITLVLRAIGDDNEVFIGLSQHGYALFGASMMMAIVSAQPFAMNLFGADRAGLTLQFLLPMSDRQLAWGKLVGVGLLLGIAGLIALVAALLVAPSGHPALWLAVLIGSMATYALICPVSIWLSALFPVAADLSKSGSGGNPHALASFLGFLLILLAAAPVGVTIGVTVWGVNRPELALPIVALWSAVACAIGLPLVNVASRSITFRRENLGLVAQGR